MRLGSHYLIVHAQVIDVDKGVVVPEQAVEVQAGRILKIWANDQAPKDLPILDLKGHYLAPGLINLHTHLFGNGVPKTAIANKGKSQKMLVRFAQSSLGLVYLKKIAKQCAQTALYSGVTTLRSVGDLRYVDVTVRDAINAGKYPGPRMLVSGPALTCPNGHGDGTIAVACHNKEEYLALIAKNIAHHVDLIKITLTSGVMDALDANHPGDVRMSLDEVKWVVEEAHKNHLMVASHTECTRWRADVLSKPGSIPSSMAHSSMDDIVERFKTSSSVIITTISPALPSVKLSPEYSHYSPEQIASCKIVADGIIHSSTFRAGTWRESRS
jgi:imidazolonepropionase-like amidohydrolase